MGIGGVGVVAVVVRMQMRMSVAMIMPCAKTVVDMVDMAHRLGLQAA